MGSGAKNHRFHAQPETARSPDAAAGADRRAGQDRRDPTRDGRYAGPERRRGPRRQAELPTPVWRQPLGLGLAIALGVAAGLIFNSWPSPSADSQPPSTPSSTSIDPEVLAAVEALHDEAAALTAAQVALDEQAHERWMPRVAKIEAALDDPATPEPIRRELVATITALECVGVLDSHLDDPARAACATIDR